MSYYLRILKIFAVLPRSAIGQTNRPIEVENGLPCREPLFFNETQIVVTWEFIININLVKLLCVTFT